MIDDDDWQSGATVAMAFHKDRGTVSCLQDSLQRNGVALLPQSDSEQYYGYLPHVPAGGAYSCAYIYAGARATIDVVAQERPVIRMPHARDDIPRASPLSPRPRSHRFPRHCW